MNVTVEPGTYVVAVSGGVDSMVLLDILRQRPELKLVVAHFDHGIRPDSRFDRELVQATAQNHKLPFVYHQANLGPGTSEDVARKARYEFLHKVRTASGASAIITAHHHNDALETAVINMLRGTGRKGLSSLSSRENVHRPLLHLEKQHLKQYAQDQGLVWREDSTNQDTKYLRNYVRHKILPQFDSESLDQLKQIVLKMSDINKELDTQLLHYLHVQPAIDRLDRKTFAQLPHAVSKEVMAAWLRRHGIRDFDQKTLERLVVGAKTLVPGKAMDIVNKGSVTIYKQHLALKALDR